MTHHNFTIYGKTLTTCLTFKTTDEANAFMEVNEDYGMLAETEQGIVVAKCSDKGK